MSLTYRMVTRDFTPYTMIPRHSGIREYRSKIHKTPKRLAPHHNDKNLSYDRREYNASIAAKRERIVALYLLRLSRFEIATKLSLPIRQINYHLKLAGYDYRHDSDIALVAREALEGKVGMYAGAIKVGVGKDVFREIVRELSTHEKRGDAIT